MISSLGYLRIESADVGEQVAGELGNYRHRRARRSLNKLPLSDDAQIAMVRDLVRLCGVRRLYQHRLLVRIHSS